MLQSERNCFRKKTCLWPIILGAMFLFITNINTEAQPNQQQGPVLIKGKVQDETGMPLPGTSIVVVGTIKGVVTGADGDYTIEVHQGDELKFSFVGYIDQVIKVGNQTSIDVVLKENIAELDEVVVVGYGAQKRAHLTGAVSQVSSKELNKTPMQNVSNMLTGKLSGLTSIQQSGKPGEDGTILYLRGLNTFSGSNGPLVIIDGVPGAMNDLNSNDIETVSVLKDASASIYGVQGANGVILITTKNGSESAPQISYDGSVMLVQNTAMPEYLDAAGYMYWHNKAREMDGQTPLWTADIQNRVMNNDPNSIWGQTDWFGKIFRTGITQQHNLSATGGTEKVRYYASIGFMDQEGTLRNTGLTRYNVRTNLDIKVAKNLKFTAHLSGYRTDTNYPGFDIGSQTEYNPIRQAIDAIPIIKSEFEGLPTAWQWGGGYTVNPYAALYETGYKRSNRYNIDSNFKLEYDFSDLLSILKGLKVSVFASYNYSQNAYLNFGRYYQVYRINSNLDEGVLGASGYPQGSELVKQSSWGDNWMLRPQIEYAREFDGKHFVGATLLMEERKTFSSYVLGRKIGFYSDNPIDINMGTEYLDEAWGKHTEGSYSNTGQKSYVGRVNYAYGGKYMAEFAFRYDGSYRFAPENRWGFFPSAFIGWVVSQEDFMKSVSAVDFLKIRASYGQAGNDDIRLNGNPLYFQYNSTYALSSNSMAFGDRSVTQFYTSNAYVYRYLTWSTTHLYNLGFELNMWRGKLGVELDVFYQQTSDILEGVGANFPPSLGGYYPAIENSGKVENKGFEITLKHNNQINSDWSYGFRGSFSFARNKILHKANADNHPNYRPNVGGPMNVRYGFKALGLFQTQEEIDQYPNAPSGNIRLGEIKYLDVNGDGKISSDHDYVKIGHGDVPEINFNLNMDIAWKDFSLSMIWQGVARCDYELSGVYNNGVTASTRYTNSFGEGGNSPTYLVEDAWTPDNPTARFPRLSATANGNNAWRSSWWVINGNYLRLKNLNLSYSLPANILNKTPFSRVNVYLAGTNLLTFSHFKWIDPESPSVSNGYYPQQKTYSVGLNLTF